MATQIKADRIVNSNDQEFAFEYDGVPEDGQGLVWDGTKKLFKNAAVGVTPLDGSTEELAAPSAKYIKELTGTTTDGYYWIRKPGDTNAYQIF